MNLASRHEEVWGSGGRTPSFLTCVLDGSEWSAPAALQPWKQSSYLFLWSAVGPRTSLRSVLRLPVAANVVPMSPILVTLMMEVTHSSETSVLIRAAR
jgi:hypothetical protein